MEMASLLLHPNAVAAHPLIDSPFHSSSIDRPVWKGWVGMPNISPSPLLLVSMHSLVEDPSPAPLSPICAGMRAFGTLTYSRIHTGVLLPSSVVPIYSCAQLGVHCLLRVDLELRGLNE